MKNEINKYIFKISYLCLKKQLNINLKEPFANDQYLLQIVKNYTSSVLTGVDNVKSSIIETVTIEKFYKRKFLCKILIFSRFFFKFFLICFFFRLIQIHTIGLIYTNRLEERN